MSFAILLKFIRRVNELPTAVMFAGILRIVLSKYKYGTMVAL